MLADDSGLVVPALGGAPGVHSARYAGPDAIGRGPRSKTASWPCTARRARTVARDLCAFWCSPKQAKRAACFQRPPKESCWKPRAGSMVLVTIPFFSSPRWERRTRKSRGEEKNSAQPSRKSVSQGARISAGRAGEELGSDAAALCYIRALVEMKKQKSKKAPQAASRVQSHARCAVPAAATSPGNRSEARTRDPSKTGRSLSRCDLRAGTRESVSTADFHDPFRAMHGCARQSGDEDTLFEI